MYKKIDLPLKSFKSNKRHFEQISIPFTKGYIVPSLVWTGPVVREKKSKMKKVYNDIHDRQRTKWKNYHMKNTYTFLQPPHPCFEVVLKLWSPTFRSSMYISFIHPLKLAELVNSGDLYKRLFTRLLFWQFQLQCLFKNCIMWDLTSMP